VNPRLDGLFLPATFASFKLNQSLIKVCKGLLKLLMISRTLCKISSAAPYRPERIKNHP
jgi:hypothetical protein